MSTQFSTQQASQTANQAKRIALIAELCAARGTHYKDLQGYRSL